MASFFRRKKPASEDTKKNSSSRKPQRRGERKDKYAATNETSSVERISKKLFEDMRQSIKALGMFPVLSPKWVAMVDHVRRIAKISEMEQAMPKKAENETLWDSGEVALRCIMEAEKLNVCLRLIHDVKVFQYEVLDNGATLEDAESDLVKGFEAALGTILMRAWKHVEAMQSTDMPLLLEHCSLVLQKSLLYPQVFSNPKFSEAQETLVLYYLRDTLQHMSDEAFPSRRIMHFFVKNVLVERLVMLMNMKHKHYKAVDLLTACEALSLTFDSDEYHVDKTRFVGRDLRQELVSLDGNVVGDLTKDDRDKARRIRTLLDQIALFKMSLAK